MSMGRDPITGEEVTTRSGCHTRTVWRYDPRANNGKGASSVAPHMPWLEDIPDTMVREDLAPGGEGDKVAGFDDSVEVTCHVRDPEYAGWMWKKQG